jgi:hypothetical protein
MSDTSKPRRPRRMPWDFHPSLTEERLIAAAGLLVRGREDAVAQADYWAGDDAWSIGCRAYSFTKHQVRAAAEGGRYHWLKVLDHTHHFVFMIDDVPVRFYRGDAEDPSKRTLLRQQLEATQISMVLGREFEEEGVMFRLAIETDEDGHVTRVVFLALRGEQGVTECFWPVPMAERAAAKVEAPRGRRNSAAALQLPLLPGAGPVLPPAAPGKPSRRPGSQPAPSRKAG